MIKVGAMETAPFNRPVMAQRTPINNVVGGSSTTSGTGTSSNAAVTHAHTLPMCSVRSMSVASISSEGSSESHGYGVEQEEITALTQDVRNFKEALGHLRRVFHSDREFHESVSVVAHERLGDVLRILRTVLERYPALQHTELLMSASSLIQQVKGYNYEDEKSNPKEFYEAIDQLALAFSRRVPGYLMGDLDASASYLGSITSSKTKSYETLAARPNSGRSWVRPSTGILGGTGDESPGEQPEWELVRTEQAVEALLRRAKHCSKYLKDVITYVEKRAHLDLEYAKNLSKLAQTVRPLISEEIHLPLQSTFCTALDHDISNCNIFQETNALILGSKFLEPMNGRRNEHERRRKQLKEQWTRELKRMQEAESTKRKAHAFHLQRQQALKVAASQSDVADSSASAGARSERRRKAEDEAVQKVLEAESAYKLACIEVDERALQLQTVKADILYNVQSMLMLFDQTLKSSSMHYFQLQHSMNTAAPTQFQTLYENCSQYEPGLQFTDFAKRFCALASQKHANESLGSSYPGGMDKEPRSIDSLNMDPDFSLNPQGPDGKGYFSKKAWSSSSQPGLGSDTDSSHSTKSREPSPINTPSTLNRTGHFSGDEIQLKPDYEGQASQPSGVSRASESHKFRKIKGNNYRCQECDTKLYHHALECMECGLMCHKECTKTLTIQCGPTRLPEKLSVFGVDLAQHLAETKTMVPHILVKCIKEIDTNGLTIKGIYRISGVKSKVEKLCQDFETGADRVDLNGMNAHVIASVLKLYLRQLPEPLLTFKLYASFVRLAKEWPTSEEHVDLRELQELIQSLPVHHRNSLHMLMQHLYRVSTHAETNSMPPSNLGIVFGPTLLRTPEGNTSLSCLQDTVHQTKAIELLITHTKNLFPFSSMPVHAKVVHSPEECVKTFEVSNDNSSLEVILPGYITENLAAANEPLSSPECEVNSSQADDPILGFTSDDELLESLLPDCSPAAPNSPLLQRTSNIRPVIFRTALRDYKGLEGADSDSLILNLPDSNDNSQTKLKKSKTVNEVDKITLTHKVERESESTQKELRKISKGTPPAMIARVESLADSDFESHLSSSIESPSPKDNDDDDGKQIARDDGSKTDPSAPTSSLEESQSEGEREDYGIESSPIRRAAVISTLQRVQLQEGKVNQSPIMSSNIMHTTKHHFSVVTSHFVGRRSSSVKSESGVSHQVESSKVRRSQTVEESASVKKLTHGTNTDTRDRNLPGKQNSSKTEGHMI